MQRQEGIPPLLRLRHRADGGYPALRAEKAVEKMAAIFLETFYPCSATVINRGPIKREARRHRHRRSGKRLASAALGH
jgi:hypothetical protein